MSVLLVAALVVAFYAVVALVGLALCRAAQHGDRFHPPLNRSDQRP